MTGWFGMGRSLSGFGGILSGIRCRRDWWGHRRNSVGVVLGGGTPGDLVKGAPLGRVRRSATSEQGATLPHNGREAGPTGAKSDQRARGRTNGREVGPTGARPDQRARSQTKEREVRPGAGCPRLVGRFCGLSRGPARGPLPSRRAGRFGRLRGGRCRIRTSSGGCRRVP